MSKSYGFENFDFISPTDCCPWVLSGSALFDHHCLVIGGWSSDDERVEGLFKYLSFYCDFVRIVVHA